ncbi:MAG: hypothetical protein DCC55_22530, partial [Chloroflexi bacterium]
MVKAANNPETEDKPEVSGSLVEMLSDMLDADLYIYSGQLGFEGVNLFIDAVEFQPRRTNAALFLTTWGGIAEAAYMIARHIKRRYQKFILYIFGVCKSAGTLLALGADEIVMSCRGELGPLDVQIMKDDEMGMRSSGLVISQALDSISEAAFGIFEQSFLQLKTRSGGIITTRTASSIASSIAVGLLSPITDQIDPLRLGENERAMKVAVEYGRRLNPDLRKVNRLTVEYPSHIFVIDFEEAEEIFGNVREPTDLEIVFEHDMMETLEEKTGHSCIRMPHPELPIVLRLRVAEEEIAHVETNSDFSAGTTNSTT